MRTWRGARIALIVLVALVAFSCSVGVAAANGKPVRVTLGYVEGVSNWGPKDAFGSGIVAVADAEVTLDIAGLPTLTDEIYHVWLVESDGGRYVSIGTFDMGNSGQASFHQVIEDLPSGPYSMVVITVEPRSKTASTPGDRRSIVGQIPRGKPAALPTPIPSPPPSSITPTVVPTSTAGPMTEAVAEQPGTGPVAYLPATGISGSHSAALGVGAFAIAGSLVVCLVGGGLTMRKRDRARVSEVSE